MIRLISHGIVTENPRFKEINGQFYLYCPIQHRQLSIKNGEKPSIKDITIDCIINPDMIPINRIPKKNEYVYVEGMTNLGELCISSASLKVDKLNVICREYGDMIIN